MTLFPHNDELVGALVEQQATLRPGALCLVDGRVRLSYREVDDAINRLATYLHQLGVRRGDVVGIQLPNWSEYVIAFLAAVKIGAAAAFIPETHRANEVRHALALTRPKVVVAPRSYREFDFSSMYRSLDGAGTAFHLLVVEPDSEAGADPLGRFRPPIPRLSASGEASSNRAVVPDDPALILFTSGSEGASKGAVHSHRTLLHTVRPMVPALELKDDEVSLVVSPLSTPAGLVASTLAVVCQGGTVILQERFEPRATLEHISRERVTLLAGTPAHFHLLLSDPDLAAYDLSSVRVVRLTGASAPPQVVQSIRERMRCRVAIGYGMTEIGVLTMTRPGDPVETLCSTVGQPLPSIEAGIFDEGGRRLGPGETGHIAARGPSVFLGYLGEDRRINGATERDGWLFTGDLGFIDQDGNLHFVGRHKELINRGGTKISPVEVEQLLLEHPKVEAVAVVGMPDARLGEKACACVVPRPGQTVTLTELVDFLRQKGVATFKLPERLELMESLPLTRNLKVAKEALRSDIARRLEDV